MDFNGFTETVKAVTDSKEGALKGVLPARDFIRTSSRFRYEHADYPESRQSFRQRTIFGKFEKETTHLLAEGLATMPMGKGFHHNGQLPDAENRPIVGGRLASARMDLEGRFRFECWVAPIPPLGAFGVDGFVGALPTRSCCLERRDEAGAPFVFLCQNASCAVARCFGYGICFSWED